METYEHRSAGNAVRIETFSNPYFKGSTGLAPDAANNLQLTLMHQLDGVPMPLDLHLSAGDVVALAGDYYTKAGWGLDLNIPHHAPHGQEENEQLIQQPVSNKEAQAFRQAYEDLASPHVSQQTIKQIFAIDKSRIIPSLLKQLIYPALVKNYGTKLTHNEAHFSPWSLRAYIVGHESALRMAEMAYYCQQRALGNEHIPETIAEQLEALLKTIAKDPQKYKLATQPQQLWTELSHRYHAMAVARDLFAMHYYSDHFAGGHLSRLGMMRALLPDRFGTWGSILVNNMHNEDNELGVVVANSFIPPIPDDHKFQMLREDCKAYGDGTYYRRDNNENSNMLINGMDNSLGDIARLMATGEKRNAADYGGLTFLPAIDYSKSQTQPLFIYGEDNQIYFRADLKHIKRLEPEAYQATLKSPAAHGYKVLTPWSAFLLVVKLRVLSVFYKPSVEAAVKTESKQSLAKLSSAAVVAGAELQKSMMTEELGLWRSNSGASFALSNMSLLAKEGEKAPIFEDQAPTVVTDFSM